MAEHCGHGLMDHLSTSLEDSSAESSVDYRDRAQGVPEGSNTINWTRNLPCDVLAKNMVGFVLVLRLCLRLNLHKSEAMNNFFTWVFRFQTPAGPQACARSTSAYLNHFPNPDGFILIKI